MQKRKVAYYYDPEIALYQFSANHPMRSHRIKMTDELIHAYKLTDYLDMIPIEKGPTKGIDLSCFHTDDYVDFLKSITSENQKYFADQILKYNIGEDCPIFDGIYEYCQICCKGSLLGASYLNQKKADIAINWSGGLHHAKKAEASGFCFVNDIVLGILELLKCHERVLYIDIDNHHGDGVEEAFYTSNRVLTFSLHKFGDYFPGTGSLQDTGIGNGKFYSTNVPLNEGVDDDSYSSVYFPVMEAIFDNYKPDAVVFQCGADSLSGDRLGCFNLSVKGHGSCLEAVIKKNIPLLIVGGGGYTLRNVARCWAYETSLALGIEITNEIPSNKYIEYFCPEYKLNTATSNMENANSKDTLQKIKLQILDNLKHVIPVGGNSTVTVPNHPLPDNEPNRLQLEKKN